MVAVFVHQVVGAASKLFAKLLHDFIHVLLREVRGAQHDGLPVWRAQKMGGWPRRRVPASSNKTHLNLKVSPSSAALPGLISKMPLKG